MNFKLNVKNQSPSGLSHNIKLPELKGEMIYTDFIIVLLRYRKKDDPIL